MLILTRERHESIVISKDIVITVLDVRADRVILGVAAPDSVPVDRAEIRDRKLREAKGGAPA